MTVCNMSIEAGARAGHDRAGRDDVRLSRRAAPRAPTGEAWTRAVERWRGARARDPGAHATTRTVVIDAGVAGAAGHLGHQPGHGRRDHRAGARSRATRDRGRAAVATARALEYMDLRPGTPLEGLPIDRVFLGSCTNGRHRGSARGGEGGPRAQGVAAACGRWWCPGSQRVKAEAEREGLDRDLHARPASSGGTRAARCASA